MILQLSLSPSLYTIEGNFDLGPFLLIEHLGRNLGKSLSLRNVTSRFPCICFWIITQLPTWGFHHQIGGGRSRRKVSDPQRLLSDVNPITRNSAVCPAMPLRYLHLCGSGWNSLMWHLGVLLTDILPLSASFFLLLKRKQNQQWGKAPVALKELQQLQGNPATLGILRNKYLKARPDIALWWNGSTSY